MAMQQQETSSVRVNLFILFIHITLFNAYYVLETDIL
jgi:hypothetical protein